MSEAGHSELYEERGSRRKDRSRKMTLSTATFIVAIVALSGLAISVGNLADHYHDSKYKAQYLIVSSLAYSIQTAQAMIYGMMDLNQSQDERLAYSESANRILDMTQNSACEVMVMYADGSDESITFDAVDRAADGMQTAVYYYEVRLSEAIRHNESYAADSTANSLFQNATQHMGDLADLIWAGVDESRDWHTQPYSLVNRMNLDAIDDVSAQIENDASMLNALLQLAV